MTSAPDLVWPDALVLEPRILAEGLESIGIDTEWAGQDVTIFDRLYDLLGDGRFRKKTDPDEVHDFPPPEYTPDVVTEEFWNRLTWGTTKKAHLRTSFTKKSQAKYKVDIDSTSWDSSRAAKPTWEELRIIVVKEWLRRTAILLGNDEEPGSIAGCLRHFVDQAQEQSTLPRNIQSKPSSILHLGNLKEVSGSFPKTTLMDRQGRCVEVRTRQEAISIAEEALKLHNRIETARNLLDEKCRKQLVLLADPNGGLAASKPEIERMNARTAAINLLHSWLGPSTGQAEFQRIMQSF